MPMNVSIRAANHVWTNAQANVQANALENALANAWSIVLTIFQTARAVVSAHSSLPLGACQAAP